MNETAYNHWVYQQLEPEDKLPHHHRDVTPYTGTQLVRVYQDKINSIQQEEEDNEKQDAYLKSKGIN